jgi:exodeoxyribonuclease VII small subunit
VADKTPKPTPPVKPVPAPTEDRYETLIEQLEELVEQIESGEIGLEQSIEAYERGVGLVARPSSGSRPWTSTPSESPAQPMNPVEPLNGPMNASVCPTGS